MAERLVRRSSQSEGGSDTHQLLFTPRWVSERAQPILGVLPILRDSHFVASSG
jgi:hypothetical protein